MTDHNTLPLKIMLSYSHEDICWLEKGSRGIIPWLQNHLDKENITLWFDMDLSKHAGREFLPIIQNQIDEAHIVIILLSEDFLTSSFIHTYEMPRIRERVDAGDLALIPIMAGPVSPRTAQRHPWLFNRQIIPGDPTPLDRYVDDFSKWKNVRVEIKDAILCVADTVREYLAQKASEAAPEEIAESEEDTKFNRAPEAAPDVKSQDVAETPLPQENEPKAPPSSDSSLAAPASEKNGDAAPGTATVIPPRYRIEREISPMEIEARDLEANVTVLIHLFDSPAPLVEIQDEIEALAALNLDGIELPHHVFRGGDFIGIAALAAPSPSGEPLAGLIGDAPPAAWQAMARAACIVGKMCAILSEAHLAGVVHGGVTPAAVRLAAGDEPIIGRMARGPIHKTLKRRPDFDTQLVRLCGEPLFLSPRIRGGAAADFADDAWSAAAILLALLAGRSPAAAILAGSGAPGNPRVEEAAIRAAVPFIPGRLAAVIAEALEGRRMGLKDMARDILGIAWPGDMIEAYIEDATLQYEQGDIVAACEILDKALILEPGHAGVHHLKGKIYYTEKEYKWAILELEGALRIEPLPDVFAILGQCYVRWKGEHGKACAAYREGLRSAGLKRETEAWLRGLLAQSLRLTGAGQEAVAELERAIALESDAERRAALEADKKEWTGQA